MKSKLLYILLATGCIVLLVVSGVLMNSLFSISVPETAISTLSNSNKKHTAISVAKPIGETIIEVSDLGDLTGDITEKKSPVTSRTVQTTANNHHENGNNEIMQAKVKTTKIDVPTKIKKDEPGIGTVTSIRGLVSITSIDEKQRTLVLNSRVFVNDKITTSSKSRISVDFEDGSTLSIGEKSTIVIDKYIYDPEKHGNCGITLRFIKGVCRVITGAIAQLNPKHFEVRTRMATVGIRGCDLAFRSDQDKDDIYVISLSGAKAVEVTTTSDGSQILNILTGQSLKIDNTKKKIIDITEPQTTISIRRGQGATTGHLSLSDIRSITSDTSLLTPYHAKLKPSADGGLFILEPPSSTINTQKANTTQ